MPAPGAPGNRERNGLVFTCNPLAPDRADGGIEHVYFDRLGAVKSQVSAETCVADGEVPTV
jgi:hypothetical protein